MKHLILSIAFAFCILNIKAQTKCDTIPWTPDLQLSWSDFKGPPDNRTSFKALTSSGIHFGSSSNGKEATFETNSNFLSCLSWTKVNSDSLLEHERLHFDITEYYRRVLLQRISKVNFTKRNYSDKMHDTYNQVHAEWEKAQEDYDRETEHGVIRSKQLAWENKIRKQLQILEEFSKHDLTVQFK